MLTKPLGHFFLPVLFPLNCGVFLSVQKNNKKDCNATAAHQDEGGAAGDVDKVVNGVNGMGINAQDQLDEDMIRNNHNKYA